MPTPIVIDGTTDRVPNAPRVVFPEPSLFADRAVRFAQLARGHSMADYLELMAAVAQAQHEAFGRRSATAMAAAAAPVDPAAQQRSCEHGMPPLAAASHPRRPQWRADLSAISAWLRRAPGGRAGPILDRVAALDETAVEALADRVLTGTTLNADAPLVPFIGAALQVYFARLAADLPRSAPPGFELPVAIPTVCPVCATRPVASVVRLGGVRNNLRYLICALCSTEWNMARIKCSACEQDKGLQYFALQPEQAEGAAYKAGPGGPACKAEACDECKSYLKIFYQDQDPLIEPAADDLASLALDILVDERGFGRSGPNLLIHPGDESEE